MNILDKWSPSLAEKIRGVVLVDPSEAIDYELYCEYCKLLLIEPWQYDGSRYCENCYLEMRLEGGFRDKFALKQLLTLQCYCNNRSNGCPWVGQVHAFEEHSQICQYMEREYCQYDVLGCPFQGDQKEVSKHNVTAMPHHLGALCYTVTDVDSTESHEIILQISKTLTEISQHKKHLNDFSDLIEKIEKKFLDFCKLFADSPLKDITSKDKEILFSLRSCVNILQYLEKISEKENLLRKYFEKQSPEEKKIFFTKTKNEIENKIEALDIFFSENERKLKKAESRFSDFREISQDGYLLIRIDNILEKIETARHFGSNEYRSPYVYTHKYGYKCYMKIDFCTSVDSSLASPGYVGIFIILVPGKYDEILKFPVPYSFKIKIKNFARRADKTYTLLPDPDKDFFQRAWGEESMPVGFMKFISHEELLQKGYVTEGAIYIELTANDESVNVPSAQSASSDEENSTIASTSLVRSRAT